MRLLRTSGSRRLARSTSVGAFCVRRPATPRERPLYCSTYGQAGGSLAEEALGEGGDQADLDDQADERLDGGEDGDGRVQGDRGVGDEAAAVEGEHAEDGGVERGEGDAGGGAEAHVGGGEGEDDRDVEDEAAPGAIAVAGEQVEEVRAEVGEEGAAAQEHLALERLGAVGIAICLLAEALVAQDGGELAIGAHGGFEIGEADGSVLGLAFGVAEGAGGVLVAELAQW